MITGIQRRADPRCETPAPFQAGWISSWVRRRQQELSDRIHASGDALAYRQGWQITKSTGQLGFEARSYRDPRFDGQRRGADTAAEQCVVSGRADGEGPRR